ncbi:hypothetical protein, partial [Helicobacter sp. T3_23-1059]
MIYNKKYSLGIYVNRFWWQIGGAGNPHIFLGLKIEKAKCSETQIGMQKRLYESFMKNNMTEAVNQCKLKIKQMECFIAESTLNDLKEKLDKECKYTFTSNKKYKAWQDAITDTNDSFNRDFDKELREKLNADFAFLRQCYADITEPFFQWLKTIKRETFTEQDEFSKFKNLFNEFVESKYSNIDSIEGFFGFGPYETGVFRKYKNNNHQTGGKVFQNNHWNDELLHKTKDVPLSDLQQKQYSIKSMPRTPLNKNDKKFLAYSKGHQLIYLRPLKTFQDAQSEVFEINENEYKNITKAILFQTLLTSNELRKCPNIFSNDNNIFRDYKLIGNSCVDFVMDKISLVRELSYYDKITILPSSMLKVAKQHLNKSTVSKQDKITLFLLETQIYEKCYADLCSLDSSWEC